MNVSLRAVVVPSSRASQRIVERKDAPNRQLTDDVNSWGFRFFERRYRAAHAVRKFAPTDCDFDVIKTGWPTNE
jgi:hypothetical protein